MLDLCIFITWFSLEKAILWIEGLFEALNDDFFNELLGDNLCIIVMFYQLFGLSFWWHPFTAEHPLVSKRFNAKFLQVCSDEEIVIFVQTIPLIAIEDMQINSETESVSDWCFTEASAVTETGLISQETYFSDVCQIDWYFMHGISQK